MATAIDSTVSAASSTALMSSTRILRESPSERMKRANPTRAMDVRVDIWSDANELRDRALRAAAPRSSTPASEKPRNRIARAACTVTRKLTIGTTETANPARGADWGRIAWAASTASTPIANTPKRKTPRPTEPPRKSRSESS